MPNWVNGVGSGSAKLIVIGECPNKYEDESGIPFAGSSGDLVDEMLKEAGTERDKCYITNVYKVRPPDNDIERIVETGYTHEYFVNILNKEISTISPNCILALGNLALKTLTPFSGINHYRGSILRSIHGGKLVSTVHPANLLEHRGEGIYTWKSKAFIQLDFNRAVEESRYPEIELPSRALWICKDSLNLANYLERNKDNEKLAVDVETYHTIPICIGLAFSSSEAISIPLLNVLSSENPEGINSTELATLWSMISEVLANEKVKKVGQNFKFDERILRGVGFKINGFYSDIMLKFHSCFAEFPKKLEFQTSILTREPYYKNEGSEYNPKKDNFSRLLLYNARDAVVTYEVDEKLEKEIEEYGVKSVYYDFTMKLHRFYYDMEDNGILLNKVRHKEVVNKYETKQRTEQITLEFLVGHPVNVQSPKQCAELLYDELKLPKRVKRRKGGKSSISTDENVLCRFSQMLLKMKREGLLLDIYYKSEDIIKPLEHILE